MVGRPEFYLEIGVYNISYMGELQRSYVRASYQKTTTLALDVTCKGLLMK